MLLQCIAHPLLIVLLPAWALGASLGDVAWAAADPGSQARPQAIPQAAPKAIKDLLKPAVYKAVVEDREVMTHAVIEEVEAPTPALLKGSPGQPSPPDPSDPLKKYSFYAAMLVRESLEHTHREMTHYSVYPQMVSYIDQVEPVAAEGRPLAIQPAAVPSASPSSRSSDRPAGPVAHFPFVISSPAPLAASPLFLKIIGGIWRFRLITLAKFEEKSPNWVHFTLVGGHFAGMQGDLLFESLGSKGTLTYIRGELTGTRWPPAFIIERGAEVVLSYTGRRMRSYTEAQK